MRNDLLLKLQRIIEGNDRITWDLFPDIYDCFLEADELSLAEDRMLQLVASTIKRCADDKIIYTSSEEKIAEWEKEFGLSSDGLTLEQRRQQVAEYITRSRVLNEAKLHNICQSIATSEIYERIDHINLTLGIFTAAVDGEIPVDVVSQIKPVVPQNLALYAGVETSFSRSATIYHTNVAALDSGLGVVEWHEPPEPPVEYLYFGGDFSGNDITLNSVDGGGSVINRYNPGRSLFSNTGWVDGEMITRYNPGRALFELRGWDPGGCFWDVLGNFIVMDSTTGNVISSIQIWNTDLPIDIDVLDPPEIIDPTAPEELLIGVTTECPAGTTSLNSEYFWAYAFGRTYYGDTNWYDPSYYQNATPPYYQSDSTLTPVDGAKYSEVVLTNGAGGTYSPNSFALSLYNSKPELYLDNGFGSQSSIHNGVIVKYGSDIPTQSLNLPSDMYTISGTTIWWNDNHPLMILLQGKPFIIPENHIDVILGLRWETDLSEGGWRSINFNTGYFSYAGVLSESDKTNLEGFGLSIRTLARAGDIGNVIYDSNYSYEILAVYSDIGETEIPFSSGDLLVEFNSSPEGAATPYILTIRSPASANIQAKSWKCRITKVS